MTSYEALAARMKKDKPTDWVILCERGDYRLAYIGQNQCDGCAAGIPITDGVHAGRGMLMFCQAGRYE